MEKTWKETDQEGVVIVDRKRKGRGYLYRVSLHRPTIYTFNSVSRDEDRAKTEHRVYTLLLMEGVDHSGWCLEIDQHGAKVSIEMEYFDPRLTVSPDVEGRTSLWEHLDEAD
jgi:hypothetical protein